MVWGITRHRNHSLLQQQWFRLHRHRHHGFWNNGDRRLGNLDASDLLARAIPSEKTIAGPASSPISAFDGRIVQPTDIRPSYISRRAKNGFRRSTRLHGYLSDYRSGFWFRRRTNFSTKPIEVIAVSLVV